MLLRGSGYFPFVTFGNYNPLHQKLSSKCLSQDSRRRKSTDILTALGAIISPLLSLLYSMKINKQQNRSISRCESHRGQQSPAPSIRPLHRENIRQLFHFTPSSESPDMALPRAFITGPRRICSLLQGCVAINSRWRCDSHSKCFEMGRFRDGARP